MSHDLRLVAGITLTELRRHAGAWRLPILASVLFSLLIVAFASSARGLQERAEDRSFSIATELDPDEAEGLVEELTTARLVPQERDSVVEAVGDSESAAGSRLPDDADARLAAGETVPITIYVRQRHYNSREAQTLLQERLAELDLRYAGEDPSPVVLDRREVSRDEGVSRLRFGRTVATVVALLGVGLVTAVATHLGSIRDQGGAEALLVLPLDRRALAGGFALGSLPVVLAQLAVSVGVLLALALLPLPNLGLSLSTVLDAAVPALFVVALLGLLVSSLGVLAGSLGGGTDDAVSVGDLLAMPFLAVGLTLFVVPDLASNPGTTAVPLLGPALVLRDAVAGDVDLVDAAVATVVTLVVTGLFLAAAAARLSSEKQVRLVR